MTQTAPSSISVSRLLRALAITAVLLIATDQGSGLFLDYVYGRSSGSPLGRIAMTRPTNLVLGSSSAKYAIDPDAFLPATYNAARDGADLFYVAAMMRNLPPNGALKRVIIGFDPNDFVVGFKNSNFKHLWRIAPLGRRDPLLRNWLTLDEPMKEVHFASGLLPYRGEVVSLIRRWIRPWLKGNGFETLEGQAEAFPGWYESTSVKVPVKPEALAAIQSIAAAAKRLDVQVVAVITPLAGALRELDPQYGEVLTTVRSVLSGSGYCDLIGYSGDEMKRFAMASDFFYDGAHLNREGANSYSTILAQHIGDQCR